MFQGEKAITNSDYFGATREEATLEMLLMKESKDHTSSLKRELFCEDG